ncbi:hypothetical protein jhhlp_002335 [Lomentospora prolificans]|uniref:Uncharacterized protein n=1 Tax=Lomentospora prolificans TaxID=41688 RepID=A0A2N3NDT6_9PEZI|nr:hypothetical protein jhhlp_002335 [Lomentospora prolificans]
MTTTHSTAGGPGGISHSLATSSSYSSLRSQSQPKSGPGLKHIDVQYQPTPDASLDGATDSNVDSAAPISKWADAVLSSALDDISSHQPGNMLRTLAGG